MSKCVICGAETKGMVYDPNIGDKVPLCDDCRNTHFQKCKICGEHQIPFYGPFNIRNRTSGAPENHSRHGPRTYQYRDFRHYRGRRPIIHDFRRDTEQGNPRADERTKGVPAGIQTWRAEAPTAQS